MVVSAQKVKAMPSRNFKDAVQCGSGLEDIRMEAHNAFLRRSSLPTKAFRRCHDLLLHHPHRLPMPTVLNSSNDTPGDSQTVSEKGQDRVVSNYHQRISPLLLC